ncbi:MAG TPA: RDD family protein [Polyangiales bacterium]
MSDVAPSPFAGFWRRVAADVIDRAVLAAVAFPPAWFCRYELSKLGPSGAWIGLVLATLYFGLMSSSNGAGQTLGKRWLKLRVLRSDGRYMNVPRSFARYLIMSSFFFNDVWGSLLVLAPESVAKILSVPFLLVVISFAVSYLVLLPLHPAKRGLHDFITDTVVIHGEHYEPTTLTAVDPKRVRRAVSSALAVGLLAFALASYATLSVGASAQEQAKAVQRELSRDYQVLAAMSLKSSSTKRGATRAFSVSIWIPLASNEDPAAVRQIKDDVAKRVRAALGFQALFDFDEVDITLVSGFKVGVTSWTTKNLTRFPRGPLADRFGVRRRALATRVLWVMRSCRSFTAVRF